VNGKLGFQRVNQGECMLDSRRLLAPGFEFHRSVPRVDHVMRVRDYHEFKIRGWQMTEVVVAAHAVEKVVPGFSSSGLLKFSGLRMRDLRHGILKWSGEKGVGLP